MHLLGLGACVHHHQAGAGARCDLGNGRVQQATGVVDQRRAGVHGGGDRLRAPGVDRDQNARVGEGLDHRAELIDLLLDAHRRGVGATGQNADVDDACAGGSQIEAALHLLLDALEGVRVGDGVPADVEDAHDYGRARVQIERRLW